MKLYGVYRSSYFTRVMIVAAAKGLVLQTEADLPAGMSSVLGKIPVLETAEGALLCESTIIMDYLEEAYPTPSLLPPTPYDRARARLFGRIADLYLPPAFMPLCQQLFTGALEPNSNAERLAMIREVLGALERLADGSHYLVGDTLTLADAALAPFMYYLLAVLPAFAPAAPLAGLPALARWWTLIRSERVTGPLLEKLGASLREKLGAHSSCLATV